MAELEDLAARAGVVVEVVDAEVLDRMLPRAQTRGVVAQARPPEFVDLEALLEGFADTPNRQVMVALDEVEDPQNLGAIMRSCEFFGVRGLVWTRDRAASVTPSVVRASAGASERLPLCLVTNLAAAIETCREAGLWVVGTVVEGGQPLHDLVRGRHLPDRLLVVLGSEGRGLRRLTRERCDFLATIGQHGAVGSLNVSAAAAVTLSWLSAPEPNEPAKAD